MATAKPVSRLLAFVSGAFPIVFAFGYLPVDLYSHNLQALGGDVWLPHLFAIVGAAALVAVAALAIWRRSAMWLANVGFGVGLFLLLADWLSPVQLSSLDGARFGSTEPLVNTLIELALAVVVGVILLRLPQGDVRIRTQAIVSGILAIYVAGSLLLLPGYAPTTALVSPQPPSPLPNIYHFHLDELQSDYALATMEVPDVAAAFEGFVVFERNISNYPFTQPSVPSYLTSSTYESGGYLDWVHGFDRGLLADLKAAGYRIEVVGLPEHVQTPMATSFRSPESLFQADLGIGHPQLVEFTSLWLARLLPNALTNRALAWGTSGGALLSGWLDAPLPPGMPRTVQEGLHPFEAVAAIRHLLRHEAGEPGTGRYLFVQAILPHAPYVFDETCTFGGHADRPVGEQYGRQASCAVRLVAEFLTELKRLGRYDRSVIIVQSDHGSGWAGFLGAGDQSNVPDAKPFAPRFTEFGGSDDAFRSRAMALLAIKPIGKTGALELSNAGSELLDVYPTIVDAVGLKPALRVEGTSLLPCITMGDCAAVDGRDRYFYAFPNDQAGTGMIRRRVTFDDGRPVFGPIEPVTTGSGR